MALSFSNKARGTIGSGLKLEIWEVTEDGSTTTISASDFDLNDIVSAQIIPKANLVGSVSWTTAQIADGAMEAKDVTVTGAALGDEAEVSLGVALSDLSLSGDVSASDKVTAVLNNGTSAPVDITAATLYATVMKHKGLSTYSGSSIVFGPAGTSADVFTIWVVGW